MGSTSQDSVNESCRLKGAFFSPNVFNDYRSRGDFFDVNLFTDEGSLPAHKLVLSACSDFFRDKLRQMQPAWSIGDPNMTGMFQAAPVMAAIYMSGVSQADLAAILDFIYQGEVQMSLEHLDEFLLTAQRLKIKGLIQEDEDEDENFPVAGGFKVSSALKRQMQRRTFVRPQPIVHRKRQIVEEVRQVSMDASDNIKSEETLIAEVVVKDPNEIMEVEQGTADEMDIRFEIGTWQLEMGGADVGEILDSTIGQGEVLIEGKKAKTFIKKIDKVFHCTLCNHSSKDKSNLVRHLKRRHTNPTFELCPHCGRTYKNKECLYNHMSSKRCVRPTTFDPKDPRVLSYVTYDESDKKWTCLECGSKYRQKVNAREHVVFKHLGIESVSGSESMALVDPSVSKFIEFLPTKNKWKCLSCGRMFSTSFNASHHIQQKHKKKTPSTTLSNMMPMTSADALMKDDDDEEGEAVEVITTTVTTEDDPHPHHHHHHLGEESNDSQQ